MSGAATQRQSFPLRSGETCALDNETLTFGERQIPLADIVSAGLVADTTVAVPPGMPPTPGVSLRLRDGSVLAGTPVEPLDCWRLLAALSAARPGTVGPLPPPPGGTGYGPSYGPGFATGYGPQNPYPNFAPGYPPSYPQYGPQYGPPEGDKTLAGFCHLSVFFAPVILPLVVWLAVKRTQPYASQQAKQAFFFHLFFGILSTFAVLGLQAVMFTTVFSSIGSGATPPDPTSGGFLAFPLAIFAVYGVLAVLGLINAIFSVIAAVQAFQGKPYHYPLLGWVRF